MTTPASIVLQVAAAQRDGATMTGHLAVTDGAAAEVEHHLPAPVGGRGVRWATATTRCALSP